MIYHVFFVFVIKFSIACNILFIVIKEDHLDLIESFTMFFKIIVLINQILNLKTLDFGHERIY